MAGLVLPGRYYSPDQQTLELAPPFQGSAAFFAPLNYPATRDIIAGNNLAAGSMVAPSNVFRTQGKTSLFDGATTRLSTTSPYIPSTAFTVLCWARPTALNSGYARLVETDYLTGFYLGSNTGTQYAFIVNNTALEGCIGGQQVVGQRDFVSGVFDGTTLTLYVNGLPTGTTTSTALTNATNVICIGAYPSSNNVAVWAGDIDNVGIFNRAFSAQEIYSISQNPTQLFKASPRHLYLVQSVGGGVTGTAAITNADDTSTAQGTTTVVGTVAYTNINDTSNASGSTTVTGTVAYTNLDDTGAASGTPEVTGTSATTNADDTANASGTSGTEVTGTVAYTNIDDTANASGTTTVTGTSATTNSNDTANASGATTVTGSVAYTNANDTSTASGSPEVTGTSATTNNDDTSDASGDATGGVTGTVAYTNLNDTADASGTVSIVGSVAYTNNNDTSSAFGNIAIFGSVAYFNNNDISTASGTVNSGVILESGFNPASIQRTKKPGIPTGTDPWLKNFLEILTGRRGNAIDVPQEQNLTFSATPTQAECEALYAHVNDVRATLASLINRFDT